MSKENSSREITLQLRAYENTKEFDSSFTFKVVLRVKSEEEGGLIDFGNVVFWELLLLTVLNQQG